MTKFEAYIDLIKKKDELFVVSTDNMKRKKVLVKEVGVDGEKGEALPQ